MLGLVSNRLTFDLSTPRQTDKEREVRMSVERNRKQKKVGEERQRSEQKGVNEGEG